MSVSDDIIRLRHGWTQRTSSFRFDLLDINLQQIGSLTADMDRAPSIDNNPDAALKRKLSSLWIPVSESNQIDYLSDRIRVMMVIPGAGEFECGVFVPVEPIERPGTRQSWENVDGLDQLTLLDQDFEQTWAVGPGRFVAAALAELFEKAMIPIYHIEEMTTIVSGREWLVYKAGDNMLDAAADLCDIGACYTPYFENGGVGRVRRVPDLASVDPVATYGLGDGVLHETYEVARSTWKLPNRFIVTSSGDNQEVISGFWDVPKSAPHSKEKRGRIITEKYDVPGLDTNEDATAAAKAKGQTHDRVYEVHDWETPIDPRLDTFEVVTFDGVKLHHGGYSYTCREGEWMQHNGRRIYTDDDLAA